MSSLLSLKRQRTTSPTVVPADTTFPLEGTVIRVAHRASMFFTVSHVCVVGIAPDYFPCWVQTCDGMEKGNNTNFLLLLLSLP